MTVTKAVLEARDGSASVPFQFNPATLSFTKAARLVQEPTVGAESAPAASFVGSEPMTLTLTMLIDDVEDAGTKVVERVSTLVGWTTAVELGDERTVPPLVFRWGGLKLGASSDFPCALSSVQVGYQMFDPSGRPIRAECQLSLTEIPNEPGPTNPSSGALRAHRSHVVTRSDSLPLIAQRVYGDAGRWRLIAETNRIVDPFALVPGSELVLPERPLEEGVA